MAISFEESRRRSRELIAKQNATSNLSVVSINEESSDFEQSSNYTWYDDYSDSDYSLIDSHKEILLNSNQTNLTQELNSQVIPFEMPRYYDGVDLMKMNLKIHFINANNKEGVSSPINVCYNSKLIRFYWLVDGDVTEKDGNIKFEIVALGTIRIPGSTNTKRYLWRTKPNNKLIVEKALSETNMLSNITTASLGKAIIGSIVLGKEDIK